MEKWKDLKNRYNCLKSILIQKYGNPTTCIEEFQGYSEDNHSKLYLICNHLRIFACQKRVKSF